MYMVFQKSQPCLFRFTAWARSGLPVRCAFLMAACTPGSISSSQPAVRSRADACSSSDSWNPVSSCSGSDTASRRWSGSVGSITEAACTLFLTTLRTADRISSLVSSTPSSSHEEASEHAAWETCLRPSVPPPGQSQVVAALEATLSPRLPNLLRSPSLAMLVSGLMGSQALPAKSCASVWGGAGWARAIPRASWGRSTCWAHWRCEEELVEPTP
mmetsp:Transcript_10624/g.29734  ORF Transcript_10624/g.29734 Transcript_10624/m.29734 type:complete len:215 (+) Transcript_10624:663-1307(+)